MFRWEKKVIKSEYLSKNFGIQNAIDLLDQNKMNLLAKDLLDAFNKLILIDCFNPANLKPKQFTVFNLCANQKFWEAQYLKLNRSARKRIKDAFLRTIEEKELDTTKRVMCQELQTKINNICNCHGLTNSNSVRELDVLQRFDPYIYS